MRIVLCCATHRGLRFLERLAALQPAAEIVVCSFPEEPHEPPFLESLRQRAAELGQPFVEARRLGAPRLEPLWQESGFDVLLAVSWRYLIPRTVFGRARLGAYVFHDSLLPAYRGFSPTVWAMVNGEDHTGVTLCRMEDEVDAGDVVRQERVPIGPTETIADVMERVTETYLQVLETALPGLLSGDAPGTPQDPTRATYCCPRRQEDNEIDWNAPGERTFDLVRAVTRPYSGAFTWLGGRRLTVWSARTVKDAPRYAGRIPGRVIAAHDGGGARVLTGDGVLELESVQLEGEEELPAGHVLRPPFQTLGDRERP